MAARISRDCSSCGRRWCGWEVCDAWPWRSVQREYTAKRTLRTLSPETCSWRFRAMSFFNVSQAASSSPCVSEDARNSSINSSRASTYSSSSSSACRVHVHGVGAVKHQRRTGTGQKRARDEETHAARRDVGRVGLDVQAERREGLGQVGVEVVRRVVGHVRVVVVVVAEVLVIVAVAVRTPCTSELSRRVEEENAECQAKRAGWFVAVVLLLGVHF